MKKMKNPMQWVIAMLVGVIALGHPATLYAGDTTYCGPVAKNQTDVRQGVDVRQKTDVNVQTNANVNASSSSKSDSRSASKSHATANNSGITVEGDCPTIPVAPLPYSGGSIGGGARPADFGRQVTSVDLAAFVANGYSMDAAGYDVFLYAIDEFGSKSWSSIKGKIIVKPSMRKKFTRLTDDEAVYYFPGSMVRQHSLHADNIVGALMLDSKPEKKYPVVPTDFIGRIYEIARDMGANRVYIIDKYEQLRLKSKSGLSIGGLLGAVTGCATGGSVSLGLGSGKEVFAYGKAGILVILYRDVAPVVTASGCSWESIESLEKAVSHCPDPNFNNASLRKRLADAYLCKYYTTKDMNDLKEANENYDIARRDVVNGKEPDGTKTVSFAQDLLRAVNYNQSLAIRMQHGEQAQFDFARKHGLTRVPENVSELK